MADGGTDPQRKVGAANEIALSEGEAPAPDHPVAQRTAQQRVAGVGAEPDSDEDDTQHDELRRNRPISRIHELREKGDEEEGRLRIKDRNQKPLRKNPRQRRATGFDPGGYVVVALQEATDAEIDQVRRPEIFDDAKRQGG